MQGLPYNGGDSMGSSARVASATAALVQSCRVELARLDTKVKASRSHRQRAESLYSSASDAVAGLEATLMVPNATKEQLIALQDLAVRLRNAIDTASDTVTTHGHTSALDKLCSCGGGSEAVDKFDASATELRTLAATSRALPLSAAIASTRTAAQPAPSTPRALSDQMMSENSGTSSMQLPSQGRLDSWATSEGASVGWAAGSQVGLSSTSEWRLRKPSRQEEVSGVAFVPVDSGGRVWMYVSRLFGADKFSVCDLTTKVEQPVKGIKTEGGVTTMYLDYQGILWTGHKSGAVIAWREAEKTTLCAGVRPFSTSVRCITTDENGMVWVGSDRGDVRRIALAGRTAASGEVLEYELHMQGFLRHTGSGGPERSATTDLDAETDMVRNLRAKERAHEGHVSCLAAAVGRVWTCGGSSAFVCLREWTRQGEFIRKTDLKSIGGATAMLFVAPVVRVSIPADPVSSLSSSIISSVVPSPKPAAELPQAWQLLTGHGNGVVQVWGDYRGTLSPLLRIGGESSPITGLSVFAPLGMVCTAHLDGRLMLHGIPAISSPGALSVRVIEGSVSSVKLPHGEVKVADSGISGVIAGNSGLVTVAYDASVSFWSTAVVLAAARTAGIETTDPTAPPDQWTPRQLNAAEVQAAAFAPSPSSSQQMTPPPTAGAAAALQFSENAARWQIDYEDLQMNRVVGEGAFGRVYLGRWHETDVAIKVLTSLAALGLSISADDLATASPEAREALRTLEREVGLLVGMRHPNVILFMGLCPNPPCVVTEYCSRGSLYDLLQEARTDDDLAALLNWPRRLGLALDAAKGMLYLHSHKPPIIHRDLKSPNLLVDGNWRVKVADLNLSKAPEKAAASVLSSVVANNPRWHAPEIIKSHTFSGAGDVYAFGLIMWELATWDLPYESLTPYQIMLNVAERGSRPPIPSEDSPELRGGGFPGYPAYVELMKACWAQNPRDRPGFDQIIVSLRAIVASLAAAGPAAAAAVRVMVEPRESVTVDTVPAVERVEEMAAAPGPAVAPPPAALGVAAPAPPSPFDMAGPFGGGGGAVPSPFDGPAAAAPAPAAASAAPPHPFDMGGPFGGGGGAPPSPFDAPSSAAPAQAMPSPFDSAALAAAAATTGPPAGGLRSPFDAPPAGQQKGGFGQKRSDSAAEEHSAASAGSNGKMRVIDSVKESAEGKMSSGEDR